MANLQELLNTGRFALHSENSFDTELSEYVKTYEVIAKSKYVKFTWRYGDDEYTCDQQDYEERTNIQAKGRLCLYMSDFFGNIYESDPVGLGTVGCYNCVLCGMSSQDEPSRLQYNFSWGLSKNFTTNGSEGGNTPLGNTNLRNYIELNARFPVVFTYDASWGIRGQRIELFINIPIFESWEDAEEYIRTGDTSKSVNPLPPIESDADAEFYYYDYELDTVDPVTKSILNRGQTQSAKFKMRTSSEYVAFVRLSDNIYELSSTSDTVLLFNTDTNKYDIPTSFSNVKIEVINGIKENQLGDIYTNIPFVENLEDAKNYQNLQDSFNGIDDSMELTTIDVNGSFIGAYYVSVGEMNNIATILFSNDTTVKTALKEGLWMYGENPVDCVVDLCFYPFDLSSFISQSASRQLKFGSFAYNGELPSVGQTSYTKVTGTNSPLTLVNQRLIPIYNDFRDYNSVSYSLFLPYYGIIPIENSAIGEVLKVTVYFDIFTSQMKYYIFVKNSLYTVVECSVGRHMSVVGSNWLTKSGQNVNDFNNMLTSVGDVASGLLSANLGGAIGGMTSMIGASMNYLSKPVTTISGSTTGGMNIFDPMSCYLIIEQYETIKPFNLNSEYGIPCYNIIPIGQCNGFTQISDIKLNTRATIEEQNEIIQLLKDGVII